MSNLVTFIIGQIQAQTFVGLLLLIAVFFYVGLITIGGGQVAITIMQEVIVERFALLPASDFFNMVAISESTPTPYSEMPDNFESSLTVIPSSPASDIFWSSPSSMSARIAWNVSGEKAILIASIFASIALILSV